MLGQFHKLHSSLSQFSSTSTTFPVTAIKSACIPIILNMTLRSGKTDTHARTHTHGGGEYTPHCICTYGKPKCAVDSPKYENRIYMYCLPSFGEEELNQNMLGTNTHKLTILIPYPV